jgi:hypothetical protein
MNQKRLMISLLTAAPLGMLGAACTVVGAPDQTGGSTQATSLADTKIPKNFRFETTKKASLKLSYSAEKLGEAGGIVEVKRVDGATLYWGPISAEQPAEIDLVVPSYQTELEVALHQKGAKKQTARVALGSQPATHTFE